MNNLGTQTLVTERLILRKGKLDDALELFESCSSDELITRYVVWNTHQSVQETADMLDRWELSYQSDHSYKWMIIKGDSDEIIGTITVVGHSIKNKTAEIGYAFGSKFWNNGFGTEALKAVIKFLVTEVGFEIISANYVCNNLASGRIMEKAGMIYEGKLRKRLVDKINGERLDLISYSILKEELNY